MVNIQTLITSGTLELYVLGLASEDEKNEIEGNLAKHPELHEEIKAIRHSLQLYAESHAVNPPSEQLQSILRFVENEVPSKSLGRLKENTLAEKQVKTASSPSIPSGSRIDASRLMLIVLGTGFILSMLGIAFFYNKASEASDKITALELEITRLRGTNEADKAVENLAMEQLAFLRKKGLKTTILKGNTANINLAARVNYDPESREALIDFPELEPAPTGKSYHLWAVTNGKVTYLGELKPVKAPKPMQRIGTFNRPQSFIVTLENTGTVEKPSLDQIILAGVVAKD